MRLIKLLNEIHSYYLKLSGKKKLLVFLMVFILGVIIGSAFNSKEENLELEANEYQDNSYIENGQDSTKEDDDENEESLMDLIRELMIEEEIEDDEVIVVIDPGHGGEDLGTYYRDMLEKDLNLDISLRMGPIIEEAGINVVYTRTEDEDVSLDERAFIANTLDATLFVSIHNNAMPGNPNYRGTETLYCAPQTPVYSKMDGQKFASIVQKNLVNTLNTIDNGTLHRPNLAVLRKTAMPAVIAEIAYVTNASDRELLRQDEFKQKAAQALADSVFEALEVMEAKVDEEGVWRVQK
ncbi:N-acetylmuramoyl-L-alanine amidase [Herbivorax sp. ANBcel31]|uniref:N-acetylmuramoyl-L-alanine amidase family protein n=1 Tax=Herbivorax sp. ANBcel31 TaxID=3069754 RepID=UPI0027B15C1F|nr:N-acetylmuramoyl-L-alanine amidase [Herbivorax sp. ANBcel31]MDQ2085943.1 N-acetylmuramoyl-L-alanine amidase [Herbivorax sp. ANBcel31]